VLHSDPVIFFSLEMFVGNYNLFKYGGPPARLGQFNGSANANFKKKERIKYLNAT